MSIFTQRELSAIQLVETEGKQIKIAARELGVAPETVKKALYTARFKRRMLESACASCSLRLQSNHGRKTSSSN